ncbi:MAG TPA: MauE/DoxX family redox-associated membrane protein [Steroidobacteraceae bacterium]|nr:MauE/DoxX family redox-associated membrane protein [Steroidobacteraceae bacterium]
MRLDPVVATLLRLCFGLLFAVAAVHKARDFGDFSVTLDKYLNGIRPLGGPLVGPLATRLAGCAVIALEFAVAIACAVPSAGLVAALGAMALLSSYAAAMYANVYRGNVLLDCGCSWGALRQPVSRALVVRNVALIVPAAGMMLPAAARPLLPIDVFSIVAAAGCTAAIYSGIHSLLALTQVQEAR